MLHWDALIDLPDSALAAHDVGAVNLACAAGLPGTEGLDADGCLAVLDDWAGHVRRETGRCAGQFRQDPTAFENSWAYFRVLVMSTVLQQDCGVRYDPDLVGRDDFFSRPAHLFIHGVIRGEGGTCSSLPPVYVAVGRRLGYPLRLVQTYDHVFARWDEPGTGERFNVECTSRGLNCHPDDYYRTWPRPTTPRDVERYGWLVSQSPREDLAWFLVTRGHCLLDNRLYREAVEAYAQAVALTSRHRGYESCVRSALVRWGDHLARSAPPHLPRRTTRRPDRNFSWLPPDLQDEFARLQAVEDIVGDIPENAEDCIGRLRTPLRSRTDGALIPYMATIRDKLGH